MDVESAEQQIFPVTVDQSGRILLPSELRKPLGVEPGTGVVWIKDKSGLRLQTFAERLKEIQSYFQSLSPPDDVWSEELIAERRREAAYDNDGD